MIESNIYVVHIDIFVPHQNLRINTRFYLQNDDSPPCYLSAQESTTQWLTSPPVISIRTRTNQLNNEKSANNVHSINRSANSNQVSYGLLDALETIVFLLNVSHIYIIHNLYL
ncbi:unnamed protein product [Schistosoma mattheei]|uniref:Uncharacterized protein n=1 Tax=Schistosoma mattheei TaxID=31246 RepID=A0A183Q488_9TREM|nr:unnamed protein product [Schistosoma mattheei]